MYVIYIYKIRVILAGNLEKHSQIWFKGQWFKCGKIVCMQYQ